MRPGPSQTVVIARRSFFLPLLQPCPPPPCYLLPASWSMCTNGSSTLGHAGERAADGEALALQAARCRGHQHHRTVGRRRIQGWNTWQDRGVGVDGWHDRFSGLVGPLLIVLSGYLQ